MNPLKTPSMKFTLVLVTAFMVTLAGLFAADQFKTGVDPLAGAFFPPELVLLARDRIALTADQLAAVRTAMEKAQPKSGELRMKLEREAAALAAIVKQDRVDVAALNTQLDKVLDLEREAKHLHIGLAAAIKNLLTADQQSNLRELAKNSAGQLGDDVRRRLSDKVNRVIAITRERGEGGQDISAFAKTMAEKVKPLIDAGKVIEAEAELDRLLDQLAKSAK